ncbi:MAG: hypothetical protein ABSA21_07610 [Candidatus Limnocylindrales bacterium]|jgi:hypothetical protein
MNHHRRILATLGTLVLMAGVAALAPAYAAAATPAATFVTPAPGVITVLQTGSYAASWTITKGVAVSTTTVVVQTSRPIGVSGCDIRWLPARSSAVSGTSYQANGLPLNRCYRFMLMLATGTGQQTVTSAPIIPAPAGLGATATFTNPFLDGVVAYDTTARIGWAERDTFGSKIVSRSLYEQSAPALNGGCTGVAWSTPAKVSFTGSSVVRTVRRSYCYRYLLTLQDAAGFRSLLTSGAMPVASTLPAWTGTLDFYEPSDFASQATTTWCVAASSQMMLNMILGQSDSSSSSQATYIAYGQANDGASYSQGTDPAGWVAILNRYGGAGYSVQRFTDSTSALKKAAIRMRLTNKPVGMLVWQGRHAWVMNGFSATADPATTSDFTITAVYVTGPLYPRPANASGYDQPPDTELTPGQLSKYFVKYYDSQVKTWNGGYVLVMP